MVPESGHMMQINDRFAELIAVYPERLLALATIDAFEGEATAQEVERTIQTSGLQGICVDCAQGDRYLDESEARPTLIAAASLGVPVFVHPISLSA
jgi:predicted TIM-barrel fold metal-dependent hydrolase